LQHNFYLAVANEAGSSESARHPFDPRSGIVFLTISTVPVSDHNDTTMVFKQMSKHSRLQAVSSLQSCIVRPGRWLDFLKKIEIVANNVLNIKEISPSSSFSKI
jgi:hypothetical protein